MGQELERAINAGDVIAAVVDTMALHDVPVSSRAKGILAKQAKELLEDGFDADTVLAASVIALRRGQPHVAHYVAQDLALAQKGQHLTRDDYRAELASAKQHLDPVRQGLSSTLDAIYAQRAAKREKATADDQGRLW